MLVGGLQLHVLGALVEDVALDLAAVGSLDFGSLTGMRAAGAKSAQVSDELVHLGVGEGEGRHAARGNAVVDEAGQVLVGAGGEASDNSRAVFAAGSVAAVAACTAAFEVALAGLGRLGERGGQKEKCDG